MEKNYERQDLFEVKSSRVNQSPVDAYMNQLNECPQQDKDGNCLVPGVYRDSEEIGGG